MYHVMSRGDQRNDIFLDDMDRHEFIKTLAEACQKTDWWVHAFCLMKNHYKRVTDRRCRVGCSTGREVELVEQSC